MGREGIAPDRLLRCVALKHIKGWSFRELRWELRTNLLYRRFTRFYEDPIPDFTNLSRAFALFGREGTEEIHQRIVQQAKAAGVPWERNYALTPRRWKVTSIILPTAHFWLIPCVCSPAL